MNDIAIEASNETIEIDWKSLEIPVVASSSTRKWAGVARMGGCGDNLIAASVLAPLKKLGYMVEVISQEPYSDIFVNNPHIDKLTTKKSGDIPGNGGIEWQKWFAGRAKEYDRFANLSHSCENLVALFPAQTAFWWPVEARRKFCNRNYLEVAHDILDVPYEFGPLFYPTDGEKKIAAQTKAKIGERCIGWIISGTRVDKIYPYAPIAVARLLHEVGPVVMFGAPGKDFEMAKQIMEHVEQQNGSATGLHLALSPDPNHPSWPIRRILSQALACDLIITPDTGPAWAVAFEPMPKIAMLSHASPENITKHWINTTTLHAGSQLKCWPCHRLHDEPGTCMPNKENNGAACISDISVERLIEAVKAKWS